MVLLFLIKATFTIHIYSGEVYVIPKNFPLRSEHQGQCCVHPPGQRTILKNQNFSWTKPKKGLFFAPKIKSVIID